MFCSSAVPFKCQGWDGYQVPLDLAGYFRVAWASAFFMLVSNTCGLGILVWLGKGWWSPKQVQINLTIMDNPVPLHFTPCQSPLFKTYVQYMLVLHSVCLIQWPLIPDIEKFRSTLSRMPSDGSPAGWWSNTLSAGASTSALFIFPSEEQGSSNAKEIQCFLWTALPPHWNWSTSTLNFRSHNVVPLQELPYHVLMEKRKHYMGQI